MKQHRIIFILIIFSNNNFTLNLELMFENKQLNEWDFCRDSEASVWVWQRHTKLIASWKHLQL